MLLVLTIIGSPLWLPLLIAAVSVVIALVIAGWGIIAGGFVSYVSLAIIAVTGVGFGFIRIFTIGFTTGIAYMGIGIISAGVMMLLFYPCVWITKQWIRLNVLPLRKLRKWLVRKE